MAGDPADVGAPKPSEDLLAAGVSLCQDYLTQVRDGSIVCRPGISSIDGRTVRFDDGSSETVDAIICATGYDVDIPYLSRAVRERLGPDLALYQRTFHPDVPGLGVIGQFPAQARTCRCSSFRRAGSRRCGAARRRSPTFEPCVTLPPGLGRRSTPTTHWR